MSKWVAKFADNGWMDWYCPHCGRWVLNDDVHVTLDWKFCPYCGEIADESHVSKEPVGISDSYILGYITDLIRTSWKAKADKNMEEYDRLSKQIKALNDFYDDWKEDFRSNEGRMKDEKTTTMESGTCENSQGIDCQKETVANGVQSGADTSENGTVKCVMDIQRS